MNGRLDLTNLALAVATIALAAALWFGFYWLIPLELAPPRAR